MADDQKWYDAHLKVYEKEAYIVGMDKYKDMYKRSIEDIDNFWGEAAREYLSWDKTWDFVLRYDFDKANIEWFGGGILNVSYNCLDRHLPKLKDKVAYYWEGDSPEQSKDGDLPGTLRPGK